MLSGRGLAGFQLLFPLEDAGAARGGLGLGYAAGLLQSYGEAGLSQGIGRREGDQPGRSLDGFAGAIGIEQGTNQAVVGFAAGV